MKISTQNRNSGTTEDPKPDPKPAEFDAVPAPSDNRSADNRSSDNRSSDNRSDGHRRDDSVSNPPGPVVERTRTSSAFVGTVAALVGLAIVLIFVLQNDEDTGIEFLWADFTLPIGVALLFAALLGGLIVAAGGLGRVLQLRHSARRRERAERRQR